MKNTFTHLTLLILALVPFEVTQAKCTPGDPEEFNTTCPYKPNPNSGENLKQMFGKIYCEVSSDGSTGISISEDGLVGFFAPNLGAPNPYTYFAVVKPSQISNPVQGFQIQEFQKSTGESIGTSTQYHFHQDKGVIYSDEALFSTKACKPKTS